MWSADAALDAIQCWREQVLGNLVSSPVMALVHSSVETTVIRAILRKAISQQMSKKAVHFSFEILMPQLNIAGGNQ